MFKKSKRILWLLNHKTLMPYEVPLMQRLGFEVFVPKIFPRTGLRNSAVDASYDAALSLPAAVLRTLNGFNFYEDAWTPDIVTLLNRYFACVFVIPHLSVVEQAVDQFEGQIVLRAFGLDNESTYKRFLEDLHGPLIMHKIANIQHRFWFGEGYDHLHEVEPPLFQDRRLFLPIGIPDSFFADAGQWSGQERKILFVCPNAVTDPYYSRIYRQFKQDFGDLPHVIVGAQDAPIDDPQVAGFVTDAELHRLYRDCAVLYYHSTELRHVHYSPVEAAIDGMPVVFHAHSLLGRLSRGADKGAVDSVAEARDLIERILAGDQQLIQDIRSDQREIAYLFSDAYCAPTWKKQMQERGFMKAMAPRSPLTVMATEMVRSLRKRHAQGRLKVDPHQEVLHPPMATLTADEARARYGSSLYDGIAFNTPDFPPVVDLVNGVCANESWGRWSNGAKVTILLRHKLEGEFRFMLQAMGYQDNAGQPVQVRIGTQVRVARLVDATQDAKPQWLPFDLKRPTHLIEIDVPHPIRPPGDTRELGIGLIAIGAAPPIRLRMQDARATLGGSLEDGWSLNDPTPPVFVESVDGLGAPEAWGCWSDGDQIRIVLRHTLEGRFRLMLRAVGYRDNAGLPVVVRIGAQAKSTRLVDNPADAQPQWLHFELPQPANVIEIDVPRPIRPDGDTRKLGIGLMALGVAPAVELGLADARARLGATLEDGWRFNDVELPAFVESVQGLYEPEPWGRWSRGDQVVIELKHLLVGRFDLQLRIVGYGPNVDLPVTLRIGSQERTFRPVAELGDRVTLEFDLQVPSNVIEVDVPAATSPPGDPRRLGLGFSEMRLVPVDSSADG